MSAREQALDVEAAQAWIDGFLDDMKAKPRLPPLSGWVGEDGCIVDNIKIETTADGVVVNYDLTPVRPVNFKITVIK